MSSAPPPVANSGEDAITRTVDVEPELFAAASVSLDEAYEVEMTLDEIAKGNYQRVSRSLRSATAAGDANSSSAPQIALQFPDELLHDAVPVFRSIRDRLPAEKELYVLADTTYGR